MRLVDKDKLLKELTEGQKAGLGLIEGSEYDNINSVDDAIEAVKYADEVDLSELKPENAVSINGNNGGDVVEIKDLNDGTSSVFIGTSCVPIIQGIYKNEMLPQLIFDIFIERDIDKALKNVESFKISNDKTVLNSDGSSQPLPTIGEEEIPFGDAKKEYVYGIQINNSTGFTCICFKSINKLEDFLRCRANNVFANKVVSLFTNTDKSEKITFRCGGEEYIIEKDDINYINEEYHNSFDECYQETCVEIDKEDYER